KPPEVTSTDKLTGSKTRVTSRKSAYTNAEPSKRVKSDLDETTTRPRKLESSDSSDNGDGKANGLLRNHVTSLKRSIPESEPAKENLRVKKNIKVTSFLSPKPTSENLKAKGKKTPPSPLKAKSSIKSTSPVERLARKAPSPVERQAESYARAAYLHDYESVINKPRKVADVTKTDSVIVKGKLKLYSIPDQKRKFVTLLSSQARKQLVLRSLLKNFP